MTARVVAVLGSVTPPGRFHAALSAAVQRAGGELVDLAEHPLPFAGRGLPDAPVLDAIARADAVLLATPVYRGTFTGALKNLLDLLPVQALRGKPVGIAAMGATDHHSLGADWHLRDVLAWFGAVAAPTSVYLTSRTHADGRDLDELLTTLAALAAALPTDLGPLPLAARQGA